MLTLRQIALLKFTTGLNHSVSQVVVRLSGDLNEERIGRGRDAVTMAEQKEEVSEALLALEKLLEVLSARVDGRLAPSSCECSALPCICRPEEWTVDEKVPGTFKIIARHQATGRRFVYGYVPPFPSHLCELDFIAEDRLPVAWRFVDVAGPTGVAEWVNRFAEEKPDFHVYREE